MGTATRRPGHGLPVWGLLTRGDRLLIAALLVAAAVSALPTGLARETGSRIVVEVNGEERGTYTLGRTGLVDFATPGGGAVTVQLGPEGARVVESTCRQRICVRRGWIRHAGEVIACVPNQLVVRVVGGAGSDGVDAVLR